LADFIICMCEFDFRQAHLSYPLQAHSIRSDEVIPV